MNTERVRLAGLAVVVGAVAAGGALVFEWLIRLVTSVLTGHGNYASAGHQADPHLPWLGRWFVVLAPVAAGLLYGPLLQSLAPGSRGLGVPEVMDAIAHRGGRMGLRVPLVRALGSALCIGGGGSVGREGPLVQVGAALGSAAGRLVGLPERRLRVLLASGAAATMAATFDAPLAGVLFALELLLREISAEAFAPVALAAVTAALIGRAVHGTAPVLHSPQLLPPAASAYPLLLVLGGLAGLVGVAFSHVLYRVQDTCDLLWRGPEWARPAVGGVLLGGLLVLLPQLYGTGYPVMEDAAAGRYTVGFLLVLLVGKLVATSLTIGINGPGGILAPALFLGTVLGAAYSELAHQLHPGQAGLCADLGAAAVFAAAARAPLTAVVALPELTGHDMLILPAMAACAVAVLVSRALSRDTVYTLKLRRRGVDLTG